jgi:hypothetical protein
MNLAIIEDELFRRHNLPENFAFYSWKILQDEPPLTQIIGGEFRLLKSGNRKGRKSWKGRDKAKDRTFYITKELDNEYTLAYIERTGNCPRCCGKGETLASCGVKPEGGTYTTYRQCSVCKGSGKPAESTHA